jgi:N-acetylglucosamine malate deacetylase 1
MSQPVVVLAISAHPDDAELSCGGALLKLKSQGYTTGILDLTRGELGTRGTPAIRAEEAAAASQILGLTTRICLNLPDGFFPNHEANQRQIIAVLRALRPRLVLANAPSDRHPDHGRAAELVRDACFLSGLRRIETIAADGKQQAAWRPSRLLHYIQDEHHQPQIVVDISAEFAQKMEAIRAFQSQFFNPASTEPGTHISSERYVHFLEARARVMGNMIGVEYGEGFVSHWPLPISNLMSLA